MTDLVEKAKNWFRGRVSLAESLGAGECGGTYGDAILVLSALVSGIAAEIWPGEGIDRKRFVQVWALYARKELFPNRISLPLLVETLRTEHMDVAAEKARLLRAEYISDIPELDMLVVTGERVDVEERIIIEATPEVPPSTIRAHSYGAIFYRHFRSGYVHEYKTGSHGDAHIMSHTRGDITYSNWLQAPHRRINFDIAWLVRVVGSICDAAVADYWTSNRPRPARWWIEA